MQTRTIKLNNGRQKALAVAGCVAVVAAMLLFAKWSFGHAVAVGAAEPEVAVFGRAIAGSDAQAHFEYALMLEKTQLPGDEAALREFRAAAALSPHNYIYWVALGRGLEQSGDAAAAEQALRKAGELAPNYARVRWALGNLLLRQGRTGEAFDEIRNAVAADPTYANPAASSAWNIFRGDIARISDAVGDSPRINASVAVLLASGKRFRESMDLWGSVPQDQMRGEMMETGKALYNKLLEAALYRSAIEVGNAVGIFDGVGTEVISNGGFEEALTSEQAHPFTWAISDGPFPRVGLSDAQRHLGSYSLLMSFGQGGKGSRQISQKIGVERGGQYQLRFFYRSDLKPDGKARCEVWSGGTQLAGSQLVPRPEWTEVQVPFNVPTDVEGVEMRVFVEGCTAQSCPVTGSVWFDDFDLVKL